MPPFRSPTNGDVPVDAVLRAFVDEVCSKPGGFALLEKKLVTWANQSNELPADGGCSGACPQLYLGPILAGCIISKQGFYAWAYRVRPCTPSKRASFPLQRQSVLAAPQQSLHPPVLLSAELLLLVRQVGSQLPEPDVQLLAARFATHRASVIDAGALLHAVRAFKSS